MNRKVALSLWLVLLLTWAGAGALAAVEKGPPPEEKELTLGMVAYANPGAQSLAMQPLLKYLGGKVGASIRLKLYDDYFSILQDIDQESLDLAVLSPLVFCLCLEEKELTYLATTMEGNRPFYHAVILARKDSPILTVRQLEGKKIGFVDKYSASGHVYPAAFLKGQGLIKDDKALYEPIFLGSHEKVVRALLEGKVDAAVTYDSFFQFAGHTIGEQKNVALATFRVLKLLPERIPSDAFVCRTALGPSVIDALTRALKGFKAEKTNAPSGSGVLMFNEFLFGNIDAYRTMKAHVDGIGFAGR